MPNHKFVVVVVVVVVVVAAVMQSTVTIAHEPAMSVIVINTRHDLADPFDCCRSILKKYHFRMLILGKMGAKRKKKNCSSYS